MKRAIFLGALLLTSCSPTYKRESLKESITDLAKKEYKLDVEVKEAADTVGVRLIVKNLLGELVASDQLVWKQIEDLMTVLSRVALSCDRAPDFLVLDVVDADNPRSQIVFTRYTRDLKMIMAEALSRTDFLDRLLIEFVIGDQRIAFDPGDMDIVRLMMLATDANGEDRPADASFRLDEVILPDFLAQVAANSLRRMLREKAEVTDNFLLREVTGSFTQVQDGSFKILLDLVDKPSVAKLPQAIESKILPYVAAEVGKIFKSYKFDGFSKITVVEKNSGKLLTVSKS